jgi:hypothetical protein
MNLYCIQTIIVLNQVARYVIYGRFQTANIIQKHNHSPASRCESGFFYEKDTELCYGTSDDYPTNGRLVSEGERVCSETQVANFISSLMQKAIPFFQ